VAKKTQKIAATRSQIIRDAQQTALALKVSEPLTRDFLRQHSLYSDKQRAKHFPTFAALLTASNLVVTAEKPAAPEATPQERLEVQKEKIAAKTSDQKKMLDEAVKQIAVLEKENAAIQDLRERTPQLTAIVPQKPSGDSESVAFMIMSDWHSEEEVLAGQVGGLNVHNLEVGAQRAENAWKGCQRFYDIFRRDTHIGTIVLGLLGDFITNSIHEDGAESNLLAPSDAIYRVQNLILSGIRFLLDTTDANLLIVCHSGNHGRTTKEQRIATETGNSLEQYMYYNMRDQLANEPRVKFQIAEGYHSYVRLFDDKYTVRMHHGHGMNYGGGIGGITTPVNKAISQWNKGVKANLDVFGHFHTKFDGGNFVANGSLIGYNAYALRIKADYERPSQTFFLVNKKFNAKTIVTPIYV
jgi:hypothetical protein